ncbi:MAG: DUF4286 family protein [Flavobacteriales bacterium]|nr:DUF4286 family protein [Flavobacteriales bacterium]MCB9179773.1 DUF4286 family protein [Flavobacteriales bacterium]MCB9192983.1 DUF4286 family protein [Flavobacteriales bacterium]
MIIYNVTISIDAEAHDAWSRWMTEEHIPEVLATGLFLGCRMVRVLGEADQGTTYAIQYTCIDLPTYERYREQHAPALQARTQERFGGKFHAFRTLLEVVHEA